MKRLFATALGLLALLWTSPGVQACSVCFAKNDGTDAAGRMAFYVTTGFMLIIPLTLAGGGAWWIRKRIRELDESQNAAEEDTTPESDAERK